MSDVASAPPGALNPRELDGYRHLERLAKEAIDRTRLAHPPSPVRPPNLEFIASVAGALAGEEFEIPPRPQA